MRILLDCDDVIAAFRNKVLEDASVMFGRECAGDPSWDVFKMFDGDEVKALREHVSKPGFCSSIQPIPGSHEFVESMRALGDVFIVTSPFQSPTWGYERTQWLNWHYGIHHRQVIFSGSKFVEHGDVFVDDHHTHVTAWSAEWPDKLAILMTTPGNRDTDVPFGAIRANTYSDVISLATEFKNSNG